MVGVVIKRFRHVPGNKPEYVPLYTPIGIAEVQWRYDRSNGFAVAAEIRAGVLVDEDTVPDLR